MILSSAVWVGLVGGLADAGYQFVRSGVLHLPNDRPYWAEVVWMGPLAGAALLAAFAIVFAIIHEIARRQIRVLPAAAFGAFTGVAVYGIVRTLSIGIHPVAVAVLAAGVGARVGFVAHRRPDAWRRLIYRSTPLLAGGVLVWAIAVPLARKSGETRRFAELPAADEGSPNVLLIIWDTTRAANLSAYGYERATTPTLERLAAEGVAFDRAIATAPWTLPSHISLFTGLWRHEFTAGWREPFGDEPETLGEALSGLGYATAGFSANRQYVSPVFGVDRGFARFDARGGVSLEMVAHSWWPTRALAIWLRERGPEPYQLPYRRRAADINRSLLDWLDTRAEPERPFFAFLNVFDPHAPYLPPEPYNLAFSNGQPRYFVPFHGPVPDAILPQIVTAYDTSIYYADAMLGELLDALESRGALDNTIVIVTSDHGEEFAEHGPGLLTHGRTLYLPVIHVPLVVRYPGRVRAGLRHDGAVSIRDIPATVMDLAGAEHGFPGESLAPILTGDRGDRGDRGATGGTREAGETIEVRDGGGGGRLAPRPILSQVRQRWDADRWPDWPASKGPMRSVVLDPFHYILEADGREQLFDIDADVWETRDLIDAGSPSSEAALIELRRLAGEMPAPREGG
ncbi:MAG: sulfatase [Gemmatimonadota bacterium]|nr:sulfatase [Gemmatimonadota bacterium]